MTRKERGEMEKNGKKPIIEEKRKREIEKEGGEGKKAKIKQKRREETETEGKK